MKYVFVVRSHGKILPSGEVSAVFTTADSAREYMEHITRGFMSEGRFWIERWPVATPLYPEEDYSWPPADRADRDNT